ncbi:MAG: hypothetical protein SFY95_02270 [Planctomycetota bacterium]|nr:hypothetical protein [Planctomycetota bacterium]
MPTLHPSFLKLHSAEELRESSELAPIPFPRHLDEAAPVSRIGRWDPRTDAIAQAERALKAVEGRFAELRQLLDESGDDDDRPRAA